MASQILINFNKQFLLKNLNILLIINCNRRNFNRTYQNQNNSSNDVIDIFANKFIKDSQTSSAALNMAYKYVNSLLITNQPISERNQNVDLMKDKATLKRLLCNDPELKNISEQLLNEFMLKFAQNGYVKGIKTIQNVSSWNETYQDYEATALWFSGDVNKSLKMFLKVFQDQPMILGRAISLLHIAIDNTTETKSEFVIVLMRRLVEKLADEKITSLPLFYFWQKCFLSNNFDVQSHASLLLEQYPSLIDQIRTQIVVLCQLCLTWNRFETIYRLIEILLRFNCKPECQHAFQHLFDHQYMRQNYQACIEIVKTSLHLDISLTSIQQEKFLKIVLKSGDDIKECSFPSSQQEKLLWKF